MLKTLATLNPKPQTLRSPQCQRRTSNRTQAGVSEQGYPFGGSYIEDYSLFGLFQGVPLFWKMPKFVQDEPLSCQNPQAKHRVCGLLGSGFIGVKAP